MSAFVKRATCTLFATLGMVCAATQAVRTIRFTPPHEDPRDPEPVDIDIDSVVDCLSKLIRCKTVSYTDHSQEDNAEFEKLVSLLPELYPCVFETCSLKRMEGRGLLFKWPGHKPDHPAVLMAHYDVVPADAASWDHDPFCGEVFDGALWGRGALDTKVTFSNVLYAANTLIRQGFVPQHDIYLAFSGSEEVHGNGAPSIVHWFANKSIVPELVLDEGGAVLTRSFAGVERPCALIGIAEKGYMDVRLEATSPGGHASSPVPHTPVVALARAVSAIEDNPMPLRLSGPVREMLQVLGRYTSPAYRAAIVNLNMLTPALNQIARRKGGILNALVRTTTAFTQMEGSPAHNVIPTTASVVANIRIAPGDSVNDVLAHLKSTINDENVNISVLEASEPSRVSQTDCEGYRRVACAAADTWNGCIVSPYLMMARSDSRHYGSISDRVYRFSTYDVTSDELATIHGNNERIRLDALGRSAEFYIRLMRQC